MKAEDLKSFSHIWEEDKKKYVLLHDENGYSIFCIEGEKIMFCLIEDEYIFDAVIEKMQEHGNQIYENIADIFMKKDT